MTDDELEDALGICCGNTDDMRNHIHKTLQLLHARREANYGPDRDSGGWEKGTEALVAHLGDLYSPMATVYLHFLDRLDLIEHGSGITGSWLSTAGDQILEALNRKAPLDAIVSITND